MPDRRISAELVAIVTARAQDCCEYCRSQARFAMQSLSVEHVIPRSKGGASTPGNLALSCQGCNNHKYTRTTGRDPISAQEVPLFNPRIHHWNDHFIWIEDFAMIAGLTPIGRATVVALQLNRPGLVNLRAVLYQAGEHPPS